MAVFNDHEMSNFSKRLKGLLVLAMSVHKVSSGHELFTYLWGKWTIRSIVNR